MGFQYGNNCRDSGNFSNGLKDSNGSECLSERHPIVMKTHKVKRRRQSVTTRFLYYYMTLMLFVLKPKHVALKLHNNITQILSVIEGLHLFSLGVNVLITRIRVCRLL